uniref:Strictosidine synthase conserved region domain-containing protein n=1 Tax=Acrobeloides nanus TaxID=290746 RepID=A0A914E191_9BILA
MKKIEINSASTKYDYYQFVHDFVENGPNGRVIQLQLSTGEAKVLVDGLHFANGVQLMPDKQSFLVDESGMAQITRYYIAGPRKGEREIFMKNLPFHPDNIRLNSHGTFYVASAFPRHPEKFLFWEFLGPYPTIRRLLLQLIPSPLLGKFFAVTSVEHGLVIEVDANGKILSSLHDPTGIVRETSQVTDDGEFLYIASFHRDFIAKIRKPKGPLAENHELENAQRLLRGQLHGPNSALVERGLLFSNFHSAEVHEDDHLVDYIYTTTSDGKVVQIVDGVIRKSIFLNNETCGDHADETQCGRPISIRRFDQKRLIVADAYRGIYLLDVEKESSEQIFSTERLVQGKPIAFINDVDVYNNDTILFTASSTKWDLRRYYHILLDHIPDGRVIRYTLSSGEAEVVLDQLYFPNGIQIQPDRMSFLVCETGMARVT